MCVFANIYLLATTAHLHYKRKWFNYFAKWFLRLLLGSMMISDGCFLYKTSSRWVLDTNIRYIHLSVQHTCYLRTVRIGSVLLFTNILTFLKAITNVVLVHFVVLSVFKCSSLWFKTISINSIQINVKTITMVLKIIEFGFKWVSEVNIISSLLIICPKTVPMYICTKWNKSILIVC